MSPTSKVVPIVGMNVRPARLMATGRTSPAAVSSLDRATGEQMGEPDLDEIDLAGAEADQRTDVGERQEVGCPVDAPVDRGNHLDPEPAIDVGLAWVVETGDHLRHPEDAAGDAGDDER